MPEKLVTFAHISDTHLHIDPNYTDDLVDHAAYETVQKLIDFINNFDADIDFVLHTGDLMQVPGAAEEYTEIRKILDTLKYPMHYIPGNHDNVAWLQSHFAGRNEAQFTKTFDSEFEFNGVQFILIDSRTPEEISNSVGVLSHEQLHWLDGLLNADDERPLVVAVHHHTLPLHATWIDRIGMVNGEDLHEILLKAKHRLRGVFAGHIHETVITVRDGISYYTTQSGWFQTRTYFGQKEPLRDPLRNPGFNLVTLTEKDTFVRVIRIPI